MQFNLYVHAKILAEFAAINGHIDILQYIFDQTSCIFSDIGFGSVETLEYTLLEFRFCYHCKESSLVHQ